VAYHHTPMGTLRNLSLLSVLFLCTACPMVYSQQAKHSAAISGNQLAKYKSYKSKLKDRAEKNEPDAQYILGLLYEFPQDGAPANRSGAAYWFKRASDQGHVQATYRLGLYYYDQGSDTDAYHYLEKAAKPGFPPAMTMLGEMIVKENIGGNGPYYGLFWLEKAARVGDPDAQNDLGKRAWGLYLHPSSPERSEHTPLEWFTMAAAGGSCEAAANLGGVYFNGLGVTQSSVLADQAFRRAESCPDAPAWVLEKAHHFRELIAARRLPDPSRSLPQQEISSPRLDTHEVRTAFMVGAVILAMAAASSNSGASSSGSGPYSGSTADPQASKTCTILYDVPIIPDPTYPGTTTEQRSRIGYGYECP
jgi:uncharacterized protein